jgi:uncharacterized protein (DUF2141 family)
MITVRALTYALSLLPFAATAADLTVTVKDLRSDNGAVLIAVYDSEAHFMDPRHAKFTNRAQATKGEVKFVFHDVPPGRYAVSSFHDENGNGKLDTNAFGVPTEGYGFSNGAQGTLGPPSFAQAAFDFDGKIDKSIALSLNY